MDMTNFLDVTMDDEKSVAEFLAQNAMTHQVIHNTFLEGFLNAGMAFTFTGSISGTTLTVSSPNITLSQGDAISGAGVTNGTTIASVITAGVSYSVNLSQNVIITTLTDTPFTAPVLSSTPMFWKEIDADFLNAHHEEHIAWAQALGLNLGVDLANVDPSDQKQMQDWFAQHYDATTIVAQTLNLQVM